MPSVNAFAHNNLPLLEVVDKIHLDEIMLDSQAATMIMVRLSDRIALIKPGKYDALLMRLRKLGHTPNAEA